MEGLSLQAERRFLSLERGSMHRGNFLTRPILRIACKSIPSRAEAVICCWVP